VRHLVETPVLPKKKKKQQNWTRGIAQAVESAKIKKEEGFGSVSVIESIVVGSTCRQNSSHLLSQETVRFLLSPVFHQTSCPHPGWVLPLLPSLLIL
jgi:hypothetical protein